MGSLAWERLSLKPTDTRFFNFRFSLHDFGLRWHCFFSYVGLHVPELTAIARRGKLIGIGGPGAPHVFQLDRVEDLPGHVLLYAIVINSVF